MLILLTGKQGCGKSCTAKVLAGNAKVVAIDPILELMGPEIGAGPPTSFDLWEKVDEERIVELLLRGLKKRYSELENHHGHVIVEGSILCNRWFTTPLLAALGKHLQVDPPALVIRQYYLNASNEEILKNIRERAEREPSRRLELKQFTSVQDIAAYHANFDLIMKRAENADWIMECDRNALERMLREDLATET